MKTRSNPHGSLSVLMVLAGVISSGAQEPIFQASDLLGTQTNGFRVRVVNSGSVGNINVGESVLAGGSLPGNGRGLYGTLDFGGTAGSFATTVPYPAGASGDNFALEATSLVNIPAAGSYVFGVDGDDGFRLRMGSALGTVSEFVDPTGNSNKRVVLTFDKAGLQPVRLTHFEFGGGEFLEFYSRPGTDLAPPSTPGATLVGNTGGGGLQSIAGGQFFIRDVKSTGSLGNIANVESMLNGTVAPASEATGFNSVVNFLDGGAAGNYGGDAAFPGGGSRDHFGAEATGMIYVSEPGTYTFATNNDDGTRLQINGSRVINDDPGFHAPTVMLGQYTFAEAGFYDIRNVFLEAGGGAHMELAVAKGAQASFDANLFRLVGDVSNGGLAVFSPKGWKADSNGDFAAASNWRAGQVAGGTDALATFSIVDLTADRTVTINGTPTLGNLRFGDIDATGGANNWTVSGAGSLNLDVSGGKPMVDVLNNRASINLSVTGTDGLAKTGSGVLSMGAAAGFTGDVDIRKGTIELGISDALPTAATITLGSGTSSGKLQLNGYSQVVSVLTTNGTGTENRVVGGSSTTGQLTINTGAGRNDIFNGLLGGPGANENNFGFSKTGTGTLQLAKQNTYTGDTVVTGGTLQLGLSATVSGASLWLDGDDSSRLSLSGALVNQWSDKSGNNRNAIASGGARPVAGTNALAGGRGVVTFDGADDAMAVDLSFLANSGYTIFAVEGRTDAGNRYFLGTGPGATNQALHVGYRDTDTYTLAQFANDLDVAVPAFGTQQFTVWSNVLDTSSGHSVFRNGALAGSNPNTIAMTAANNGQVGTGFQAGQNFMGDVSEILIYNRSLTAAERQSVEAYLSLKWSTPKIAENILPATTNLQIGSAGTLELNGTSQTVASISDVSGAGGILRNNSGPNVTFATGSGNGTTTFSGSIQDGPGRTISLVKQGTGSQTLAGTGINYTGSTAVNQGRLVIQNTGANFDTPSISVATGAVLEFNATSGNTIQFNSNGQTITGTGTLEKTGPGELWFGGSGQTINISLGSGALIDVKDGILRNEYYAGNWSANLADLNIESTATVYLWDADITVDALIGTGTVEKGQNNTHTLTVGVDNGSGVFSGAIKNTTGVINLTKTGSGTQTLSGANTFSGITTINGGTLLMGAANVLPNTSAVKLDGGTLGADGFSNTTAGTIDLLSSSVIDYGTSGSGNSVLSFSKLNWTSGTLSVWNWTGAIWASNGTEQLRFSSANNPVGDFANVQFYSGNGSGPVGIGGRFVDVGGGLVELVPVPEPGAAGAAALLLGAIGWRGRRGAVRRRQAA